MLNKTNVKNVTYIGHSQGTTQMFAALSENMDFFRDKLNLFIALAPVVKVDNCTSTIIKMKDNDMIDKITNKF